MTTTPGPTSKTSSAKSFRDLEPVEEGGRIARRGFEFQDHIAAAKCLDMLLDDGPSEVWCEAEDDIVLIWIVQGIEHYEFIQAKSTNLGQAWTVDKLCRHEPASDGKGVGKSIVEKSLAHDRGLEPCRFRLVTTWEPHTLLQVLKLNLGTPARVAAANELKAAADAIEAKNGSHSSPNGNGIAFWTHNLMWEVHAAAEDVANANLIKLDKIIVKESRYLAPDQRQELYERLLRKVLNASLASGQTEKEEKRLKRADLRTWLLAQIHKIVHPTSVAGNNILERKLSDAGIDGSAAESAKEQRRKYLQEVRQPKYLPAEDRDLMESEVIARLHRLKARLDAGDFENNGKTFHSLCLTELYALRNELPTKSPPLESLLYGCMYDVMNRCLHRLVKASV